MIESYPQFREDVAVLDYFGQGYRGVFVDVGANDGVVGSNTLLPEKHGWRGVLSAIFAVFLWPLILLGINLHVKK